MRLYQLWHIAMGCVFTFLIAFIVTELLQRVKILEPITDSVLDWDFSDFAYADYNPEVVTKDTNIVIVNIGQLQRAGIAKLINKVSSYKPKVIGVDIIFSGRKTTLSDSLLKSALNIPNLVLVKNSMGSNTHPSLINKNVRFGFSEINHESGGVIRSINTKATIDNKIYVPFDAEVVKKYDLNSYNDFISRDNDQEIIHYSGREERYTVLDPDSKGFEVVKDKIVLLGYVGETTENMFFTPLKKQIFNKTIQDSHGVIIHANIISMILKGDYIKQNLLLNSLINTVLFILFTLIFFKLFNKYPNDFGLIARGISLLLIVLLTVICVELYSSLSYKYSISMGVLFLLFAPDSCEFFFKKITQKTKQLTKRTQTVFLYTFIILFIIGFLADILRLGKISVYSPAFKIYISFFLVYFTTLGSFIYIKKN